MESSLRNNLTQPDEYKPTKGNAMVTRSDSCKTVGVSNQKSLKGVNLLKSVEQTSCSGVSCTSYNYDMESFIMNNLTQPDEDKPAKGDAMATRSDSHKTVGVSNQKSLQKELAFELNDEFECEHDFTGKDTRYNDKHNKFESRCIKENKRKQQRISYIIKDYLFSKNIILDNIGFQTYHGHKYYYYNSFKNSCINVDKNQLKRFYRLIDNKHLKTLRLDDDVLLIDTTGFVFEPQLGLSDITNGLKYIYEIFTNGLDSIKNFGTDIKDKFSFLTQIPGFITTFKGINFTDLFDNFVSLFLSFYTVSYSPIGFLQFCYHLFKLVKQLNPLINYTAFHPQFVSLDVLMGAFVFFGLPANLISALKDFSLLIGRKVTASHTLQSIFSALRNILILIFEYLGSYFGLDKYTSAIVSFIDILFRPFKHYNTMLQLVNIYTKFITDQSVLHNPVFRQEALDLYENVSQDQSFADWIKNNDNKHFTSTYESFNNNLIKMARTYTTSEKDEPICIVFDGPPGSGKTVIMNKFVSWLKELNMTVYVHTVPPTETSKDFYDDYLNQDVFVMDDVGQQGKSQWRTIINFVAPIKYPLDCAQADKKNTKFFNSKIILCTTNNFEGLCGFTSKDAISHKEALFRRVHLIKVNRLPDTSFKQRLEYRKFDFLHSQTWKTEFLAHNNWTTEYHSEERKFPLKLLLSGVGTLEKTTLWLDLLLKHLTTTEQMNRDAINQQLDTGIIHQILAQHTTEEIVMDMASWSEDYAPQASDSVLAYEQYEKMLNEQTEQQRDISLATYAIDGWNQLHNGLNIFQEFVKNSYDWIIYNIKTLITLIVDKFITKILNKLEIFGKWLKTNSKFVLMIGKQISLETYTFSIDMLKILIGNVKNLLLQHSRLFTFLFPEKIEMATRFTNNDDPTIEFLDYDRESYKALAEIVGDMTLDDLATDKLLEHLDLFEEHITEDGRWLTGDKLGTEIDERKRIGIHKYAKPNIFEKVDFNVDGVYTAEIVRMNDNGNAVLDLAVPACPNPFLIIIEEIKAIYNSPFAFFEYLWSTMSFKPLIYFGLTQLAIMFVSRLFTRTFVPQISISSFFQRWFGKTTLAEDSFRLSKEKVEAMCKIEPKGKTTDFISRHMRIMVCPTTGEHTCILVSGSRFLTNTHVSKEGTIVDVYRSVEHYNNKHKEMESVKIKIVRDYITQDVTVCEFVDVIPLYPTFDRFGLTGLTDDSLKMTACDFASPYGAVGLLPTVHVIANTNPIYYKWRSGEINHKANTGYLYCIEGPGLCGSVLLADGRAIGLHVSGNGTNGFAKIFPKYLASELNELMTTGPRMKNIERYELDDRIINNFSGTRVRYPEEEKKLFYSHPLDHTDLRPTELNFCLNEKMQTLYDEIGQLPKVDELYLKSPPNYAANGTPAETLKTLGLKSFEHQGNITTDELDFIGEYIGSILPETFDDLSDDETSFGGVFVPKFNKHSSNGFGFLKGKNAVMDFEKRIMTEYGQRRLDEFERNAMDKTFDVLDLTCRESFKDELRKPDKVNKPRTFRVMPFAHIWWTKKTCGKLLKHFKEHKHDFGVCVGFNPYTDFDELHTKLSSKDIHGDADFGNWDGRSLALIAMAIKDKLLSRYNGNYPHVIDYVFVTMMRSWTVMAGDLYSTTHSLPSGTWLTLLLNCLVNKALTALTIYRTYVNKGKTPTITDVHNIVDYVTGDDKIFASDYLSDYNLKTVATVATDLGMVVTNGDKTAITTMSQDMDKLTFVKRSFVFHPVLKRWMGALDINTLLNTLQWYNTRSNASYDEILKGKCNSVLIEAYIHSPACYEKFYAFMKSSLPNLELFNQDKIIDILNDDNGYAIAQLYKHGGDSEAIWDDALRLGF
jgi:hypothetical protein